MNISLQNNVTDLQEMSAVIARDKTASVINAAEKADALGRLRAQLQDRRVTMPRLPLHPAIDAILPWGGLPFGGWHEIGTGGSANRGGLPSGGMAMENDGAATAFAAGLLAAASRQPRLNRRCVVWLPRSRGLYMPGLAAFGLTAEQLLIVRTADDTARLWATEEALRCPGVAGVLAELGPIPPVAARRLQLAAERGGALGLALQRGRGVAAVTNNVALTRWRVTAAPSQPADGLPGVGAPRWRLELQRCRGGRPASWLVEWAGGEQGIAVVEGAASAGESRSRWRLVG